MVGECDGGAHGGPGGLLVAALWHQQPTYLMDLYGLLGGGGGLPRDLRLHVPLLLLLDDTEIRGARFKMIVLHIEYVVFISISFYFSIYLTVLITYIYIYGPGLVVPPHPDQVMVHGL